MSVVRAVRVKVTKADITEGVRAHCLDCPIARAINRLLAPGLFALMSLQNVSIRNSTEYDIWNADLPSEASEFVMAFDGNRAVASFSFSIDLPAEVLK